jgi:hypothetical protein
MNDMDFWDAFWLLLIFIPLLLIWGFALVDIFQRDDMPGRIKALWVVCVVFAPFFGTLIYLIFRQPGATAGERAGIDQESREFVARYSPDDHAQQLAQLSDLHDRGKLTDAEFAAEKARLMADNPDVAPRAGTGTMTTPGPNGTIPVRHTSSGPATGKAPGPTTR